MPTCRLNVAALVCLLTSIGAATAAADEVLWSASRPLTWADFTGPVARNTAPENVAVTAASLGWSYEYLLEDTGRACHYRITRITASAVFDRDRSWSKPDHRTAAVLAHEQGHFDITQIHRLALESQTRPLVGSTGPCDGAGRRSSKRIAAEISERVRPIYDRIWRRHNAKQQAYDRETGHGTNVTAQQEWSRRIEAGLRGGADSFWRD